MKDERHGTPFTKLCMSDQSEMVSDFVDFLQEHQRADDLNTVRIAEGRTALYVAATFGRLQTVTRLLDAGADHRLARTYGHSPLFIASHEGNTAVVLLLTEKGANVNQARNDGATPLFIACWKGHANTKLFCIKCFTPLIKLSPLNYVLIYAG